MKTVVFGSCNIDLVYSVDHIVAPGETIASSGVGRHPGGKGLNQAIALSRAGSNVSFCGCVGSDGEFLTKLLEDSGVDVSLLKRSEKGTGQAFIQVANSGENSIIIYHGSNYEIDRSYVDKALSFFHEGDLIVLQNEISSLGHIIDRAYEKGMKIALNPSPFDGNVASADLNKTTYLILNEVEAKGYAGKDGIEEIVSYFRSGYPNLSVVLTLGKQGCVFFDREREIRSPAFSVKAVDTTAAGDTFTGYFLSMVSRGSDINTSLRTANAAAALAVSKKGAAPSIPLFGEVKNALTSLKKAEENKDEELTKRIKEYLKTSSSPSLGGVSRLLGYTESYMARLIKRAFGKSFSRLVIDFRVEEAALMLKNEPELSVSQIISKVGYKNGQFFRKAFYEKYGMGPLEYRKKVK